MLDRAFRAAGATVIRPESLPVADQLRTYASHETLVFSEGSALHGLQLLGRNVGRVVVLGRRGNGRFGEHFVAPRAEDYQFLRTSKAWVTGLEPDGGPNEYEGIAVFDVPALLGGLRELGIDLEPHWRPGDFAGAEAADVRQWIRSRGRVLVSRHPRSVRQLVSGLRRSGVPGARALGWRLRLQAARRWACRGRCRRARAQLNRLM
jgi:hypothetical protein